MRRLSFIIAILAAFLVARAILAADEELPPLGGTPPADETVTEETPSATTEEEEEPQEEPVKPEGVQPKKESETGLDEFIWEEEEQTRKPFDLPSGVTTKEGEVKQGPRKVTLDTVVVVNYKYLTGVDSYNVKYHINLGGTVSGDVGMIKGNAKIATDIGGYLAKSPLFECLLKVSIADIPYEMMFKKVTDSEADINVSFKGQILEDWESLCTFLDASAATFNTRGSPERWITVALEKAKPPLTKLTIPLDPEKATTLKFIITKSTVEDEGLGKAEIEGTGVVTIEPAIVKPAEGEETEGVIPNSQKFEAAKQFLQKK